MLKITAIPANVNTVSSMGLSNASRVLAWTKTTIAIFQDSNIPIAAASLQISAVDPKPCSFINLCRFHDDEKLLIFLPMNDDISPIVCRDTDMYAVKALLLRQFGDSRNWYHVARFEHPGTTDVVGVYKLIADESDEPELYNNQSAFLQYLGIEVDLIHYGYFESVYQNACNFALLLDVAVTQDIFDVCQYLHYDVLMLWIPRDKVVAAQFIARVLLLFNANQQYHNKIVADGVTPKSNLDQDSLDHVRAQMMYHLIGIGYFTIEAELSDAAARDVLLIINDVIIMKSTNVYAAADLVRNRLMTMRVMYQVNAMTPADSIQMLNTWKLDEGVVPESGSLANLIDIADAGYMYSSNILLEKLLELDIPISDYLLQLNTSIAYMLMDTVVHLTTEHAISSFRTVMALVNAVEPHVKAATKMTRTLRNNINEGDVKLVMEQLAELKTEEEYDLAKMTPEWIEHYISSLTGVMKYMFKNRHLKQVSIIQEFKIYINSITRGYTLVSDWASENDYKKMTFNNFFDLPLFSNEYTCNSWKLFKKLHSTWNGTNAVEYLRLTNGYVSMFNHIDVYPQKSVSSFFKLITSGYYIDNGKIWRENHSILTDTISHISFIRLATMITTSFIVLSDETDNWLSLTNDMIDDKFTAYLELVINA